MGQAWYYTQAGQQAGPVEWAQLQQLAASGHLGPAELVWCEGMPQWSPASSVPGLIPAAPAYAGATPYAAPTPYGAPGASLNYYTPQQQFAYAGFWLRFVAAFIDGLICSVVFIPLLMAIIFAVGGFAQYAQNQLLQNGLEILYFVLAWPYFALQESSAAQATIGKRAMGLVVTDMNGQRISFGQATGRYFGKLVSQLICCIGYMLAGWTEKKQALHDMMASTLVVRRM